MTQSRDDTRNSMELAIIGLWVSALIALAALTGLFLVASRLIHTLRSMRKVEETRALELEERVRDRTFELSAAIRDLEAFSYSVSHDLRAPLRAMSGYAGILRADLGSRLDASDLKLLDRMQVNCVKMSQLIDSLLALFRVAKRELMLESIDISTLAQSAFEDVLADYPGLLVDFKVTAQIRVVGDRAMIHALLMNLISNAVKFSSKIASPEIVFGATESEAGSILFVKDNGAGFDQAQSGLLFEPFQRLHTEAEFNGTGVGLAMCRKIVVRHKGEIWLESQPDKGTTVYFTLGILTERDEAANPPKRAEAS